MENTYNGWSNKATWLINIWITNDEYLEANIRGGVKGAHSEYEAGQGIKKYLEEDLLDDAGTLRNDLVLYALADVNWQEVAQHFTEEEETEEN